MSDIEPEKMKVTELKDELKNRGLDVKGTKAVLVKRLKAAIKKEQGIDDGGDTSLGEIDTSQEEHDDSSQDLSRTMDDSVQEEPKQNGTSDEPAVEVAQPMEQDDAKEHAEVAQDGTTGESEEPVPDSEEFQTVDEIQQDDDGKDDKRGEKRKRSRSRSRDRHRRRSPKRRSPIRVEMDDESWEAGTKFLIDRFNSDLNLRILDDGLKANPLTVEGFAFMWAGCRSMFGVKSGKVAFEVKLLENLNVDHLPEEESHPHVCRVGWSVDSSSMQLGEEPLSYGYGGTGKASTDCKFHDFGGKFTAGDVITTYIDFENEPIIISYSKNGEDLGTCFEIEKEKLEDQALFPHILSKNTEFQLNFGSQEEPWFPLKEGFIFCEAVAEEDKVRGSTPLAKKEECEALMMVGLPGAGKTVWAQKHSEENKDKRYNVLGSNNIIDKMKVMGLPRKKNYAGRWDVLIDKSIKCLNRLIEIAARKKRNYILDQTNVYASARRRKMAPFEGFQRKAVVVVPTDEEFKSRIAKREKEEGKDVPEKAVLEMKANFTIPEEGTIFDGIIFTELEKAEAAELVEKYVKEGKEALPPQKRFKRDKFGRGRFDRDRRDRRGYNDRGGWDNRNQRSGGGFRDRDRFGGDRRRDSYGNKSGGYRSGGGSGGYGGGYGANKGRQGGWGGNQGYGGNQGGGNWGNQWGGNQSQGYGGGSNWNYGGSGNQNYSGGQWGQQQGGWGGNQGYWGGNQGYNQNQGYGNSGGGGQWGYRK